VSPDQLKRALEKAERDLIQLGRPADAWRTIRVIFDSNELSVGFAYEPASARKSLGEDHARPRAAGLQIESIKQQVAAVDLRLCYETMHSRQLDRAIAALTQLQGRRFLQAVGVVD
jgi:hypothetical protein